MKSIEMSRINRPLSLWGKLAAAGLLTAALVGCGGSGSDGATGPAGPAGATGPAGPAGVDKTAGSVDARELTYYDLTNKALGGKILSVDTSGNQPIVNFQVTLKDAGLGVRGLRTFSLHIAQLQPAKDGSASYWMNYLADGLPLTADPTATTAKVNPSVDGVSTYNADGTIKAQGYAVTDNGDGTYAVKFGANIKANTKVVYDAALTHRVVVGVRSVAVPGVVGKTAGAYLGPINPLTGLVFASFTNINGTNLHYDFTPAASGAGTMLKDASGNQAFARDNVTIAACNQCHQKLEYGFPRGNNTSGHFGSRTDTKTCVMCHTPQNTAGGGDFTKFIHKVHMGSELAVTEKKFWSATENYNAFEYPQDQRNCAQCHKGAVANSQLNPSRKACGSCHNGVDFAAGTNHGLGGPRTDDKLCNTCHDNAYINYWHQPVIKPDTASIYSGGTNSNTNASYTATAGVLPDGATKISYVVTSVTRNATTGNPSITFKFQKKAPTDAAPVDVVFNTPSATVTEMMNGFVGSPSVYFAFGVAQDGIAAPADYNATVSTYIKNLWRGDHKDMKGVALAPLQADGTMVKNADGTYTITLTNAVIPATATMLTGGIGYTYSLAATQPLTQIDLARYPYTANAATVNAGVGGVGGLSVPPANVWKVATGFTGRRLITDTAKCNACHGALGVKPTFHAGQRNDAQTCTFCHNVNRTNSGWPVNINYDVHAIHNGSSGQRTNKFSWEASAGAKFWEVGYPGQLRNCEGCHITGMFDYSATTSAAAVPNLLMTTAASSSTATPPVATALPATIKTIVTGTETVPGTYYSPFVAAGATYGPAFTYYAAPTLMTGKTAGSQNLADYVPAGTTVAADDRTLVLSPISAACSGCHDSKMAQGHMEANGGTVFGTRASAKGKTESCLVCHGPAANVTNVIVPTIREVHRWW